MRQLCEQDHIAEATHEALTEFGVFLLCDHHARDQRRAGGSLVIPLTALPPELTVVLAPVSSHA